MHFSVHIAASTEIGELIAEFPEVVSDKRSETPGSEDVLHHIATKARKERCRRLNSEKYQAVNEEFEKMEQEGFICHSSSPWASS